MAMENQQSQDPNMAMEIQKSQDPNMDMYGSSIEPRSK